MQLLIPKSLTLMVILCFMSVTCFGVVLSAPSIGIVFAQQTPDFPLQSIEEDTPFTTAGDVAALTVRNVSSGSGSICEGCQVFVYNTGASPIGDVGVAYTPSSPLDLTGAKRLVFFARGELGGEVIRFAIIGNQSVSNSTAPFENLKYAVESNDITLNGDWKRYEFDLKGLDLSSVASPFAMIISDHRNSSRGEQPDFETPGVDTNVNHITYYFKGLSIDDQENLTPPLPENQTASAANQTTPATLSIGNETASAANQTTPATLSIGNETASAANQTAPATLSIGNETASAANQTAPATLSIGNETASAANQTAPATLSIGNETASAANQTAPATLSIGNETATSTFATIPSEGRAISSPQDSDANPMNVINATLVSNLKGESSANSTLPIVQNASTRLNPNALSLTVNALPNSTTPTVSSPPPESQALTSQQPSLDQQIGQPATQQEIVNALPNSTTPTVSSPPPESQALTSQQPSLDQQIGQPATQQEIVNALPNSTTPTVSSPPPESQALTSQQPSLDQKTGQT